MNPTEDAYFMSEYLQLRYAIQFRQAYVRALCNSHFPMSYCVEGMMRAWYT